MTDDQLQNAWADKLIRMIAFGTSSAIWLVGFDVASNFSFPISTTWVSQRDFAIFLFAAAVFVGLARAWFLALMIVWVVGVVLYAANAGSASLYDWLMSLVFSLIYVTLAFVAWVATAGAVWALLGGHGGIESEVA